MAADSGETPGGGSRRAMTNARSRACGSARSRTQPCSSHPWTAPASCNTEIAQPCKVRIAGRRSLKHQRQDGSSLLLTQGSDSQFGDAWRFSTCSTALVQRLLGRRLVLFVRTPRLHVAQIDLGFEERYLVLERGFRDVDVPGSGSAVAPHLPADRDRKGRFSALRLVPRGRQRQCSSVLFRISDGDEAARHVSQPGIRPSVRRPRKYRDTQLAREAGVKLNRRDPVRRH